MVRPLVYIIGAGPGAPDLVTVRGLACLQAADVVVYDHLVHPRLLRQAGRHAERIDVGSAAPQPVDQEAICYLLAEKAREGKVVARLKWGDPFVFDQGGPEALFLHEQRIPFEVVPGVPAAIGGPAYAGIPVTYPGGGDVVTFVRGHENGGRAEPKVDWASLAQLDGTIVCYAGPRQLPKMIDALISHGRDPMEGAAIILNSTLPDQQTFTGTLGELADAFRDRTLATPALLVVGKVVGLRDHLRWFDERPLFGKRVLVTRSREQAAELVELLEAAGAEPVEVPLIRIAPAEDLEPLDAACAAAGTYDWIVFTSANGVEAFMGRLLENGRDARALAGARICAVGPGTAARMSRYGLRVDLMPHDHHGEAIVKALAAQGSLEGVRVLLPKADIAREVVAEQLRDLGAHVTEVVAYRTMAAESAPELDIYGQLLEGRIDAVTFTSGSAIRSFLALFGAEQGVDLLSQTVVATIGPVTADTAVRHGITPAVVPSTYSIPALVEALVAHFREQAALSGHPQ